MNPQYSRGPHSFANQTTLMNPPAGDRQAYTGSIFDSSSGGDQKVVHWKRAVLRHLYPPLLLVFDIFLLTAIFVVADSIRHDVGILHAISRRILLAMGLISILAVALVGGYNYQTKTDRFRFVSEHLIVSIGAFILVFFLIYAFVGYGFRMYSARSVVAVTLIVFPVVSITYRYILGKAKTHFQRGNALCIIGVGSAARDLYQRLRDLESVQEVVVFDPFSRDVGKHLIADDQDSPLIEPIDSLQLNSSMDGFYVEHYVVAQPLEQLPQDLLHRLAVAQFSGNDVCSYEAYLRDKMMMISPGELNMGWALKGGFLAHKNPTYDRIKRSGDVAIGLVGLIFFSPLMLLAGLAVLVSSRGPVIFKQERVGEKENRFTLYKFRTMKVRDEDGSMYTAKNDPRLTPVGKFLRKMRIDELPQFWNLLMGDLSLVGPRAEWVELVKGYEQKFPYYHFRHAVKPGITGWAQVNYPYGASDKDTLEKLYYDLYYVRKHSLMLDSIIVVKTIFIVLFGRGQ